MDPTSEYWTKEHQENSEPDFYGKWVSVNSRLPDVNENVLSVDNKGRVYNSTWKGKYFKCVGLVWEHDNVTHWMRLPEPPTT